jgi:hypothetical protein
VLHYTWTNSGHLGFLLSNLLALEILKKISILSRFLNKNNVWYIQLFLIILHVLLVSGSYLGVFTLGSEAGDVVRIVFFVVI